MYPSENKRDIEIIDQPGGFSPACVLALESECSILQTNIQSIRVCYEVVMLNQFHIYIGIPLKEQLSSVVNGKELAKNMQVQYATYNLENYHLKPPNKTGIYLFIRMVQFRKNNNRYYCKPSSHLNVKMKEVQEVILNPSVDCMDIGGLFNGFGGKYFQVKITQSRLSYTGEVESFDTLTDSAERLRR